MQTGVFIDVFAGSLIELGEILAVALVVGQVVGWRNVFIGTGSAAALVILAGRIADTGLTRIPQTWPGILAGLILLGFGASWLGAGLGTAWSTGALAILWLTLFWGLGMALVVRRWRQARTPTVTGGA